MTRPSSIVRPADAPQWASRKSSLTSGPSSPTLPKWNVIAHSAEDSSQKKKRRISKSQSDSSEPGNGPIHPNTSSSHGSSGNEKLVRVPSATAKRASYSDKLPSQPRKPKPTARKSSLALPEFRKSRSKFYWPHNQEEEVLVASLVENPPLKFDTRDQVGRSDYSIVYAVPFPRQDGSEEWLAVKLVACDSEEEFQSAHNEVTLLKELEHNHLIAVVGAYKTLYLTEDEETKMQLGILLFPLAPSNLIARLDKLSKYNARRLDPETKDWKPNKFMKRMLTYFSCLCRALLYLHGNKIKHRDIKPGNILIDSADNVILTDLDVAKKYPSMKEAVTYGRTRCTRQYAPESVVSGKGGHGFSWDINSLGFVLLEMISIILGETNLELFGYLIGDEKCEKCGIYSHKSVDCTDILAGRKRPPPDSRSDDPHEVPIEDGKTLAYWKALKEGRIASWIERLKRIPLESPHQMPVELFGSGDQAHANVSLILAKVLDMMQAGERRLPVLREAWVLFSEYAEERCQHCHPKVG